MWGLRGVERGAYRRARLRVLPQYRITSRERKSVGPTDSPSPGVSPQPQPTTTPTPTATRTRSRTTCLVARPRPRPRPRPRRAPQPHLPHPHRRRRTTPRARRSEELRRRTQETLRRLADVFWKGYKIPQVIEAGDIAGTWLACHDVDSRTGAAGAPPLCATGAACPGAQPWVGGFAG